MSSYFYPEVITTASKSQLINKRAISRKGYIIEMNNKYYFVETDMDKIDDSTSFSTIERTYPMEEVEMSEEFYNCVYCVDFARIYLNFASVEEILRMHRLITKIEKTIEELKERVAELTKGSECIKFEVESNTQRENESGGDCFETFEEALEWVLEEMKSTDEVWYQIKVLYDDCEEDIIAFEREANFNTSDFGTYSYLFAKTEELKERVAELIEGSEDINFEVESNTQRENESGGDSFGTFEEALEWVLEEMKSTDEVWYQINVFYDNECENIIAFERNKGFNISDFGMCRQ